MGGLCVFFLADCVRGISLKASSERYQAFCKRHHYNVQVDKAKEAFCRIKGDGRCFIKGGNLQDADPAEHPTAKSRFFPCGTTV